MLLYVLLPLVAGVLTRRALQQKEASAIAQWLSKLKPWRSILGLLTTVVILFGLQAPMILAKPTAIVLIAIPLIIQSYGVFCLDVFFGQPKMQLPHCVAAPAAMIGTSNFFELAVAVAVSLFGLHSGAALATVVGVLVEFR